MTKVTDSNLQAWIEARKRHHLTHAQVQMARELGFNPKKLGKIDNHPTERWKLPLPQFIEFLYVRRFGRPPAEPVRSIEQISAAKKAKKSQRREARAAGRAAAEPSHEHQRGVGEGSLHPDGQGSWQGSARSLTCTTACSPEPES